MIYDVSVEKVGVVLKICREYLTRVQNSVFEGQISQSNLKELKMRLNNIINKDYDSIIIYKLRTQKEITKEVIGIEKTSNSNIL